MSIVFRKKTLLAKIESVYGTDPTPTGGANAMQVGNLTITPFEGETINRNNERATLGNGELVIVQRSAKMDFEVEMVGSGAVGVAPAWGPLLKACAFGETINTASVAITRASAVATVTEATHGRTTGDVVKISGCVETEYNGNQTITVTGGSTYTFAVTGTPATPATGTPVVGISTVYAPISASFPSMTFYANIDGQLVKMTGARGTVEIGVNVKQIPTLKFSFTGIYNAVTDAAAPSVTLTGFMNPLAASTTNTPAFSLFSYGGYLDNMNLNVANDVQYVSRIGYEAVNIIDRKPSGQFVIEAPTIAGKDFFAIASAGTSGAMSLTHGIVGGYKVKLDAPNVTLGNPSYSESIGVLMLTIPFVPAPTSAGNDELTISVK